MAEGPCGRQAMIGRALLALALAVLGDAAAMAQTPPSPAKTKTADPQFLDVEINPHVGTYVVTKDVNVRAKPETKSKRVGRFHQGDKISVVGRAPGAWLAVRKDGEDYGFVYEPILMEILDGTLKSPQSGSLKEKGRPDCGYSIHYEGKSAAEGQVFEIVDYVVDWSCAWKDKTLRFVTPMFMTEGATTIANKRGHQITVDILGFEASMEEVVSTTVLYERTKSRVVFDSVSESRFARKTKIDALQVEKMADALDAAVRFAYRTWNDTVWSELAKNAD